MGFAAQIDSKAGRYFRGIVVLAISLLLPGSVAAQAASATLFGAITSPSGQAIPGAKISLTNAATGQSTEAKTLATGRYNVPNLAPGDYKVSVSADGFATKVVNATLAAGAKQAIDVTLSSAQPQPPGPANKASATAPSSPENARASDAGLPSLADLGLAPNQTQGNPQAQALLDRRTRMLKIHQRLGLITTVPLVASVVTSSGAKGKHGKPGSVSGMDLHAALGSLTAGMYAATAYYAIRAPKIEGTKSRGAIRTHRALAWIHGPGMVLTPILGAMALNQENKGQKVHGIAAAHSEVAWVTVGAYGAAIISVSWPIKLKF